MRITRCFCFAFVYILSYCTSTAQDSILIKPAYIHSSFYFDYPKSYGLTAGIDFPIRSLSRNKGKKNGTTHLITRDWIINTDLGFYFSRLTNGLMLSGSIGQRFTRSGPYYFEWLTGIGGLRTFYDGIVYSVDDNNNVDEKGSFGRYYASFHMASVFGWNFGINHPSTPFAIQIKPILWFQLPYNSFALPHLSIELGFKYHPKRFNTHIKTLKNRSGI